MIGAQLVHELRPGLAIEPLSEAHQISLHLLFEPQPVAPQLGGGIAERVLVVQQEVERVLADRELVRPRLVPAREIRVELEQRLARPLRRGGETGGVRRRLQSERRGELFHEQPATLGHAHGGLDEHAHRFLEPGLQIHEKVRDVLEPPDRPCRFLRRRPVGGEQQVMQATEQMREPELGVLGLGPERPEPAQRDPDLVEQRGAVDLLLEIDGGCLLQRGGERFQCGEMRRQRGRTESAIAIVVPRHAGLRRRHRVHMPMQIEIRLFDVADAHALSNRWHSSSVRT